MEKIIEKYNTWLLNYQYEKLSLGLKNGEMGLCLYWFLQGKLFNNTSYKNLAIKVFLHVCDRISQGSNVDTSISLVEVGFGISSLVDKGYIRADINELLHEIDEKIFQSIYYGYFGGKKKTNNDYTNFLWSLIYLCNRLEHGIASKRDGILYKNLLVEGINILEEEMRDEAIRDSISFSPFSNFLPLFIRLLNRAYQINVHTDKIRMIYKELEYKICSYVPYNEGNRIVLFGEMAQLLQLLDDLSLKKRMAHYNTMLQKSIDVKNFINNELRSKQLFIQNGLSGLILYIKNNNCCVDYMPTQEEIEKKLTSSPILDSIVSNDILLNTDVSLATGITGVIYTYEYCYW